VQMGRDTITRTGARTSGVSRGSTAWRCVIEPTGPTQCGAIDEATRRAKGDDKPVVGRRMPGAGLSRQAHGKVPPDKPAFQPYWGKPAVRMIGGIEETSASFEARSAPRSYPTVVGR
jgi:hypothetical protein